MRPLPKDSDDCHELPGAAEIPPRAFRTNRVAERDLGALLEEDRRDRERDQALAETSSAMEAAAEEARDAEEASEAMALADDCLLEQGLLHELSSAEYRAWEQRVVQRVMRRGFGPYHARGTWLEVEVASGSRDGPRTSQVHRFPLPAAGDVFHLQARVVSGGEGDTDAVTQNVESVATTTNPVLAAKTAGPTVPGPTQCEANGTAMSEASTVPVDVVTNDVEGQGCRGMRLLDEQEEGQGRVPELGLTEGEGCDNYAATTLTMPEYEALYQQWVSGGISSEAVEHQIGPNVRELLEVQFVAVSGGLDTQA